MFVPTSAWLVGPATILPVEQASFAMPCVMVNHFNNGYALRLSGGGGKIFAMAADFRQDVFEPGREYDIAISVPPDFKQTVAATAHNKGTVLVNLQKNEGLYEALRTGKTLSLSIGSGTFDFALLGVSDGLDRVEECYSPEGNTRKVTEPAKGAALQAPDDAIPPAYSQAMSNTAPPEPKQEAAVPQLAAAAPAPAASVPAPVSTPVANQPRAPEESAELKRKMAQLDTMIAAAAQKLAALEPAAGRATAPAAPVAAPATIPVPAAAAAPPAPAPQPVPSQPIGRPLASTWLAPAIRQPEPPTKKDVLANNPAALPASLSGTQVRRWRAIRGTNLHEVLDVWARHEHARLLWQAEEGLAIEESVSMQGSFEEAVQAVLEQYGEDGKRPVGRIYVDPALNQKVLLIEMKRGS